MSEEEIIKKLRELISWKGKHIEIRDYEIEAIQDLLDLYNKEKEKNKIRKEIYDRDIKAINEKWKNKIREKIEERIKQYRKMGFYEAYTALVDLYEELLEE